MTHLRHDRSDFGDGWLILLVLGVGLLTFWQLVFPFDFQSPKSSAFLEERTLGELHKINFVANIVLFVPYSALGAWMLFRWWPRAANAVFLLVVLDVAIMSIVGEVLQQWLPKRTSSALDLTANVFGGSIGAAAGIRKAAWLNDRWSRLGRWLGERKWGRRAVIAVLLLLVARWAPFDVSPETYHIRSRLKFHSLEAGWPFSATRELWRAQRQGRAPTRLQVSDAMGFHRVRIDPAYARQLARQEQQRAGISLGLFAVVTFVLARAVREGRRRRGRGGGYLLAMVLALALIGTTEAGQLFVRSRLMDSTDPIGAVAGVLIGLAAAWVFRRRAVGR